MERRPPATVARWPFAGILLLHAAAVFLFTRGFLLTRTELPFYSTLSDVSLSPCFHPFTDAPPSSPLSVEATSADPSGGKCWTRPPVDRLVIIVLDALRLGVSIMGTGVSFRRGTLFMSLAFLKEYNSHCEAKACIFFDEVKPWMDKLKALQNLVSGKGSAARIFKAIADPPTTSLQRLKGLTTGGLPTFIDVGNSFGAPAIIEDNLIRQLSKSGKRVLMMGDDTWLQLFPDGFVEAYPYPSFNVKDLDTVDNGCVENLFPSLYRDDWDVLIAHFLGVDHAGHIFGVDSAQMIGKLEQYNAILEKVIEVLKNQSGPGGLHENTFMVVMGDHGQTTNGDHGGGAAEEVETALFALSLGSPAPSLSTVSDTFSCRLDLDGNETCVGSMEQLDFAVTMAALLGVPFPFGSIGHVNHELYALAAGTWEARDDYKSFSDLETWMKNYADTLCVNCWQVKRYIDRYSSASVVGFPSEDLQHLDAIYVQAQATWSNYIKVINSSENHISLENTTMGLQFFQAQINAYMIFLKKVSELARSKWTEFDLKMMSFGFCILVASLLFQLFYIRRVNQLCQTSIGSPANSGMSMKLMIAIFLVAIRAMSFLSNSYILSEGKVTNFLLATTAIIDFHCSVLNGETSLNEVMFLLLMVILRFKIDLGQTKQTAGPTSLGIASLNSYSIDTFNSIWDVMSTILPIISLPILAFLLFMIVSGVSSSRSLMFHVVGTVVSYLLIAVHWMCENNLVADFWTLQNIGRTVIPQLVYAINFLMLVILVPTQVFKWKKRLDHGEMIIIASLAILCSLNAVVLLLSGKQGPLAVVISVVGALCIIRSWGISHTKSAERPLETVLRDPLPVIKWSLLAVCMFFFTGHWCAFDGLRFGAAFIGFEHFNLIRQGVLLAIDTFGFSHILPIFGLPLLATICSRYFTHSLEKDAFFLNVIQVLLVYGFITAVTTTLTVVCVAIQRRHLMVWGLFAPKYVFDVVGLILTDVLILMASIYYM